MQKYAAFPLIIRQNVSDVYTRYLVSDVITPSS
jgi:hypothetical protein